MIASVCCAEPATGSLGMTTMPEVGDATLVGFIVSILPIGPPMEGAGGVGDGIRVGTGVIVGEGVFVGVGVFVIVAIVTSVGDGESGVCVGKA